MHEFERTITVDPAQLTHAVGDVKAIRQWSDGLEHILRRNEISPAEVRDYIDGIKAKLSVLEKVIDELDSQH